MKKYNVSGFTRIYVNQTIKANTEEEALEKLANLMFSEISKYNIDFNDLEIETED